MAVTEDLVYSVAVRATDQASPILDQFGRSVQANVAAPLQAMPAYLARLDTSIGVTARSVSRLALPLVSELSPALGQTTQQITGVLVSAALLGSGMGVLGIAAAGLAGIVGGQLLTAWQKNKQEMLEFNQAMASADPARIGAAAAQAAKDVTTLTEKLERLRQELGRGGGLMPRARAGQIVETEKERQAAIGRALQAEAELRAFTFTEALGADVAATKAAEGQLLQARQDEARRLAAEAEARALERRLAVFIPGGLEQLGVGLPQLGAEDIERALQEIAKADERERQERLARSVPIPGGLEELGLGLPMLGGADVERTRQEIQKTDQEALGLARERLGVDLQRVDILSRIPGLSRSEREDLEAMLALQRDGLRLAEADLAIAAATTDEARKIAEAKKQNIQLEAEIERAIRERQKLEQTDPLAGFLAGLDDVERDYSDFGTQMRTTTREIFGDMSRTVSEVFVAPLFGDFDKLKKLPEEFARSFLSSMSQMVTNQFLLGPLAAQLRQALGGGTSFFSLAGLGMTPSIPVAATGLTSSGVTVGLAPAGAVPGQVVQTAMGPSVVDAAGLLQLLSPSNASLFTAAGGGATGLSLTGLSGVSAASAADVLTGGTVPLGATAGVSALGVVAAGAGFVLALYGAYQSGSVAGGAVSGAISGAVLGSVVPGVGTVVGLVAGAALGAGAGALGGKEAGGESDDERSADASAVYNSLVASGITASSQLTTVTAVNGNTVGGLLLAICAEVLAGGHNADIAASGDLATIQADAATVQAALLSAGVPVEAFQSFGSMGSIGELVEWLARNAQLGPLFEAALGTIDTIVATEAQVLVGYQTALTGGVVKTTTLPYTRLGLVPAGVDLTVLSNAVLGLPDDVYAAILAKIVQVDKDSGLNLIVNDSGGAVVTVGTYTPPPPVIPAPPAPTPVEPVPDPAAELSLVTP